MGDRVPRTLVHTLCRQFTTLRTRKVKVEPIVCAKASRSPLSCPTSRKSRTKKGRLDCHELDDAC